MTYLAMRRYLPTTLELIARNLFLTKSTVRRHLAKLVEERVVLEHESGYHMFTHDNVTCYRMVHIPRRRRR